MSRDDVRKECPHPQGHSKDKICWPWPWPRSSLTHCPRIHLCNRFHAVRRNKPFLPESMMINGWYRESLLFECAVLQWFICGSIWCPHRACRGLANLHISVLAKSAVCDCRQCRSRTTVGVCWSCARCQNLKAKWNEMVYTKKQDNQ